jgi:hypothetical protein
MSETKITRTRTARPVAKKESTVTAKPATTRRRPNPATARKVAVPAAPVAVEGDALTLAAAPTIIGPNGEMIRHTQDYTVDLRDPGKETERDFAKLLDKDPSEVHHDFVAWFEKHSGYKCDVRTVQFLIATYVSDFQKDPAQKAKTIAKRDAAAAKRAAAVAAKKAKSAQGDDAKMAAKDAAHGTE